MPFLPQPAPSQPVILDFWDGRDVSPLFLQGELENIANGLMRHMPKDRVRQVMLEAFANCLSDWAEESGRPIAMRFAFEQALRRKALAGFASK